MGGFVVYIPTLPMPIVMSIGLWATSPYARAHAEPNRAGFGWRVPTTCGHECSSIQGGLLNLKLFFDFSFLIKFCLIFSGFSVRL